MESTNNENLNFDQRGVTFELMKIIGNISLDKFPNKQKKDFTVGFVSNCILGSHEIESIQSRWGNIDPKTTLTYHNARKYSLIDLLQQTKSNERNHPLLDIEYNNAVADANIFISFAYLMNYFELIDCIESFIIENKIEREYYFWFDPFVNNQWLAADKSFSWWTSTFRNSIKKIGSVIVILTPYNEPVYLNRAWCLYEFYSVLESQSTLYIRFSNYQRIQFIDDIIKSGIDIINKMLSDIDSRKSQCWLKEDLINIHSSIESTVGFDRVNYLIFDHLRTWTLQTVKNEFNNISNNMEKRLSLLLNLAKLYKHQSKYNDAELCLVSYISEIKKVYNDDHIEVIRINIELYDVLIKKNSNLDETFILCEALYLKSIEILGEHHEFISKILGLIAKCYSECILYAGWNDDVINKAEYNYNNYINKSIMIWGENHINVIHAKQSFGEYKLLIMKKITDVDSFSLFYFSIMYVIILGLLYVLVTLTSNIILYVVLGLYIFSILYVFGSTLFDYLFRFRLYKRYLFLSKEIFLVCLNFQIEKNGKIHPDTLRCEYLLALSYSFQSNYYPIVDKNTIISKEKMEKCLINNTTLFGKWDDKVIDIMKSYTEINIKLKLYEISVEYLNDIINYYFKKYGKFSVVGYNELKINIFCLFHIWKFEEIYKALNSWIIEHPDFHSSIYDYNKTNYLNLYNKIYYLWRKKSTVNNLIKPQDYYIICLYLNWINIYKNHLNIFIVLFIWIIFFLISILNPFSIFQYLSNCFGFEKYSIFINVYIVIEFIILWLFIFILRDFISIALDQNKIKSFNIFPFNWIKSLSFINKIKTNRIAT